MKATLSGIRAGALPNEVTKEGRGLGCGVGGGRPGPSASCRELPSQCFRAKGALGDHPPLDG